MGIMDVIRSKAVRSFLLPLIITASLAVLTSLAYLSHSPFLDLLELKSFDLRMKSRGVIPTSNQVMIVAIDEESLEKVGRWPWTRSTMARLVEILDRAKPRAVGYDISFFDPEKSPAQAELVLLAEHAQELELLPNDKLVAHIKERLAATDPDLTLAKTLAASQSTQILGYYFNLDPKAVSGETTLDLAARYVAERDAAGAGNDGVLPIPKAPKARTNISILAKTAHSQAYFNVIPDSDGTIRRYNLVFGHGEERYIPLAVAMASTREPSALPVLVTAGRGAQKRMVGVEAGGLYIPSDETGQMILNYRGPEQTIAHIPAWKVLTGQFDAAAIKDKYLLVGVTAPAVYDLRVTPFGVAYPGLEIQATALDSILQGDFLLRPSWAPLFDLAAIWVLAFLSLIFLWRAKAYWTLFGFIVFAVGYAWINQELFTHNHFWLNVVYPLLGFALCYLALNVYRFIFEDRQKRQIRTAFMKYLDPKVVEQVVSDPEKLALGGEKMDLTVLFSDIRGFTTISEKLAPEELVHLLNEYLTEMTNIVIHNKGLLDKYIGDAVMAVFGAPLHYTGNAIMACNAALAMTSRLEELNTAWEPAGRPRLEIGIGINSGPMVAGNMGSLNRFDYTVMGDNVNLGSRLEGLNKTYGTHIIISESTLTRTQDQFWARSLDLVRVKGKDKPVAIFELLGRRETVCPLDYVSEYEDMVRLYRDGDFAEGLAAAEKLKREHHLDPVAALYVERLKELVADPPEAWDGVFTFTHK